MNDLKNVFLAVASASAVACIGAGVNDLAPRPSGVQNDFWDVTKRPLTELSEGASAASALNASEASVAASAATSVDARPFTVGFSAASPIRTDGTGMTIIIY